MRGNVDDDEADASNGAVAGLSMVRSVQLDEPAAAWDDDDDDDDKALDDETSE